MNPGLPFISAPGDDFAALKNTLEKELRLKELELIRTSYSWCYVLEECATVTKDLSHLAFELGDGMNSRFFSLPASSYWVE